MRKLYILIFALSLFTGTAFGQMVKGHVYDAKTHEPLPGVNITYKKINGDTNGTISDADGAYEIALPDGGIDLLFSYIGYENEQLPLILRKGDTKTKDVYMNIKTNLLGDVVVSAGRFEQKLSDVTVSMDLLKAGDIAKQAPTDLSSTLNTMPGVDINDKQPSIRGGNGWTYGVGSRSLVLVDGMSALSSGNGVINWNIVPLENIEQVEVMKGASSVLYGSSALNGVINIRTKRPGLTPTTSARAYVGVYDHPVHDEYEGADVSHARRIGNFDVSGGLNLFSDDGYRDQGYNRRLRLGGNMTYHHPMKEGKLLNYGFNFNYLADKYADFFIWRSPVEVYQPSSIANMGRKGNTFYIDPFFNFTNPTNNTSHKIKTRFYYRGDNIIDGSSSHKSLDDILGNMGSDAATVTAYIDNIKNGDYSPFFPLIQPILQGDLNGIVDGAVNILNGVFPTATTADYCDLISWVMNNNKENVPKGTDKNYTYYVDYQFNKKWDNGSQITAGATYEHMKSVSKTTGTHDSDNAALFAQYDQRFFDRLSVSAGMRAEYYRVDGYLREADTKLFGTKIPVKPIFRAGLNYQLADYSFIRASFGQGYRYPSLTEKYARKDIGGVGVYPNKEVNAEKGVNAELGFKQGYKFGNLTGFFDLAGFYTQYTDMIEFRFGIFNNTTFQYITGVRDLLSMITQGQMPGFGAALSFCADLPDSAEKRTRQDAFFFSSNSSGKRRDCAPAGILLLFLLVVIDLLHQPVQFAPLLLGRTARTAVADDEDRLARNVEFVQLLLRSNVETVKRHVFRRLTARHQIEHLVGIGHLHFAHGDHIADFHLARRLGISAVYRHLVRAHGICGITAGLEHPHRPKILVQTNIVHIT